MIAAGDQIYDIAFFGRFKALENELRTPNRQSKIPLEKVEDQLNTHKIKALETLKTEAGKILVITG